MIIGVDNMKKYLKYILLTMIMIFTFGFINVEAKTYSSKLTTLYCYYDGENEIDLWCKVESSGNFNCYFAEDYNNVDITKQNINYNDFKEKEKYKCPVIYARRNLATTTDAASGFSASTTTIELSTSKFDQSDVGTKTSIGYTSTIDYFKFQNNETKTYIAGASGQNNDGNYVDDCSDIPETISLIKQIYNILRFLIPVVVIGLSIVDFLKVLLNGEEKVYKSAWSKFVKRIVIGIIILILPIILSFVIKLSGVTGNYNIDANNIFCIFS